MSFTIETRGFDEAIETLESIDVVTRLEKAANTLVAALARFAAASTPVVTGAMRGAWRGVRGRLYIDPAATNPRTGAPVTDYAGVVSGRRGIMDATYAEGERIGAMHLEEAFSGIE